MRDVVGWSGLESLCGDLPIGIEICHRTRSAPGSTSCRDSDNDLWIVINHGGESHTLCFGRVMTDLLGGGSGEIHTIGALAVLVLKKA